MQCFFSSEMTTSGRNLEVIEEAASFGTSNVSDQRREQNLHVVRGFVGDQEIDVLMDTGCEGVVVKRRILRNEQLTGHEKFIVMFNTSVLVEEIRINVRTPYFVGDFDALSVEDAICYGRGRGKNDL